MRRSSEAQQAGPAAYADEMLPRLLCRVTWRIVHLVGVARKMMAG